MESGLPDAEVLRAAAAGDRVAARRLIDEVGPVVYGYVYARVGGNRSVAEDVVQDTFLEAMRAAPTFRGEASITTWMCTIARRRLARHFEMERRQVDAALDDRLRVVEEATEHVDERDAVTRALGRLSVLHRQVLVLKYLDGLSVSAIAAELGQTRIQVQSLLQRARQALRTEMEAVA